jgi:amidohydrolase
MSSVERMVNLHGDMMAWRHDLHAHPELALQEKRTSSVVQRLLATFGTDEIHCGMGQTGVVGVLRGRSPGPAIGLRADMDALPIAEATGLAYASRNPGAMHACGHDGHTAMLLGAARYLSETRDFAGTVYLIFQPAEEAENGGDLMVRDGLFERFPMSRVFGLHNWPTVPAGVFLWREGPVLAACADIDITIIGKGAHAAHPEQGIDPVLIAAHVVTALQALVSRQLDPVEHGVISICQITGGDGYNIIPETVRLKGSARWFAPEVGDRLEAGVRRIATGTAETFGGKADIVFNRTCPATVNEAEATALARSAAERVAGQACVRQLAKPSMGAEDFAFMLSRQSGSYMILGSGRPDGSAKLHSPYYDFNDDILPVGAAYWAALVEQVLPSK